MSEVRINTEGKGWQSSYVNGRQPAHEAYRKACDLCEAVGANNAAIWDAETYEVLADLCGEED